MLVEFSGIPGSGKSHAARLLRAWLQETKKPHVDLESFVRYRAARRGEQIPSYERDDKFDLADKQADVLLKSFRNFWLEEPEYTLTYMGTLFALESDRRIRDLVASSFCYCCAQRGFFIDRCSLATSEVIIHEEGLVHRLFTLFGYRRSLANDLSALTHVAQLTPRPDVMFWMRCSPELAVKRLNARPEKIPDRLTGISAHEVEQMLAEADKRIEVGSAIFRERGTKVVELRTDIDLDYQYAFQTCFRDLNFKEEMHQLRPRDPDDE